MFKDKSFGWGILLLYIFMISQAGPGVRVLGCAKVRAGVKLAGQQRLGAEKDSGRVDGSRTLY